MKIPDPLKIGDRHDINHGLRVIANDTATGRPWMWYARDMESAQLLAKSICETTGQDVTICQYLGRIQRSAPPTEFVPADAKEEETK